MYVDKIDFLFVNPNYVIYMFTININKWYVKYLQESFYSCTDLKGQLCPGSV